jgi:magnesium-protoporphyrin O-methyltransferase
MTRATVVEASSAYLASASTEADRLGRARSIRFVHGDFVAVAPGLEPATVVALDRVVCCYPSYGRLLERSLERAERAVALSYPRDRWFVRLSTKWENAMRRRKGNPFRTYVHSPPEMHRIIEAGGFRLVSRSQTAMWSADVFARA